MNRPEKRKFKPGHLVRLVHTCDVSVTVNLGYLTVKLIRRVNSLMFTLILRVNFVNEQKSSSDIKSE